MQRLTIYSKLMGEASGPVRVAINDNYHRLGDKGRAIAHVALVCAVFALEQCLIVNTILAALAGPVLNSHPVINSILHVWAFLVQVLCWFFIGELRKPKGTRYSRVREEKQDWAWKDTEAPLADKMST